MHTIKIKSLYKQESAKIVSFIDMPLSIKVYYKDRKMSSFNRWATIVAGTIFSSLFFKSGVNYKDFDIYNKNRDIFWHSYSVAKYNMIVIGKSCVFGDRGASALNHLSRNFWENFLKKLCNPIDRFKYLLYHEVGHIMQLKKPLDFSLKDEEIERDIRECMLRDKGLEKIISEAYADCFAIYMLTHDKPEKIKPLTALVLNGRVNISHSNVSLNNFNRLDISPLILHFSENFPKNHTLGALHESIIESITYGVLKVIHLHSLQNREYEAPSLQWVSQKDRDINQRKFNYFNQAYHKIHNKNGFLSLLQNELLAHYEVKEARVLGERHLIRLFQDIEAKEFIEAHSVESFTLCNYEVQLQERQNNILVQKCLELLNSIYYLPRRGWSLQCGK